MSGSGLAEAEPAPLFRQDERPTGAAPGTVRRLPGRMTGTWVGAEVAAALAGVVITPVLTARGLIQLARQDAAGAALPLVAILGGGAVGAAATVAAHRSGTWWLAPALLGWGCALVAAGCCDAVTQR